MKTCTICSETKPLAAFRRDGRGSRICRACDSKLSAERAKHSPNALAYRERFRRRETVSFEARVCQHCGADFKFYRPRANFSGHQVGKYCSHACRCAAQRAVARCANCRRSFVVMRCMASKRKYCSQFCAGTRLRPEQVTDDVLRRLHYGRQVWRDASAAAIERDGACRACGTAVDLVAHHVIPWLISHDDSLSNLVTLCRACHANVHRSSSGRLAGETTCLR